jgi:hypothetical protein
MQTNFVLDLRWLLKRWWFWLGTGFMLVAGKSPTWPMNKFSSPDPSCGRRRATISTAAATTATARSLYTDRSARSGPRCLGGKAEAAFILHSFGF